MLTVLIIGASGSFARRLVTRLAGRDGLHLILAGRRIGPLESITRAHPGCTALRLDRDGDLAAQMNTPPDIVLDMSGPFQDYAATPVLDYAMRVGADYLDISDSHAFSARVLGRDDDVRKAGIAARTAVSTYPVLTLAVLAHLAETHGNPTSVTAGIGPSPRQPMGRNVLRAIASYAGEPIATHPPSDAKGLCATRRFTIAPPGAQPLGPRLFAQVESPEPLALPDAFPGLKRIWTGAGTRPTRLQRALVMLARLRARRLLPPLTHFVPLFALGQRMVAGLKLGGAHRSGFALEAEFADGLRRWDLVADGDAGPTIPVLGVEALIERRLKGERLTPGAQVGDDAITLADLAPKLDALGMRYDAYDPARPARNVYARLLGPAYATLPKPLQELHDVTDTHIWSGEANVQGARTFRGRVLARLLGFPPTLGDVPVTVTLSRKDGIETWQRDFDGHVFRTTQGHDPRRNLVIERFGPLAVHLAIVTENVTANGGATLRNIPVGWSAFGLPMPDALRPRGEITEHADEEGRFTFDVHVTAPLFGRLAHYRGWLVAA